MSINGRDYSSTQLDVTHPKVVRRLQKFRASLDPADVIELEEDPHVTVTYGLHTNQARPVRATMQGHGPVTIEFGSLSLFEQDDQDVLKIDVDGDGLHEAHDRLCELPNTQSYPEYRPHLTLAYLKKGTGKKYVSRRTNVEGARLSFDHITFSPKEGERVAVECSASHNDWQCAASPEERRFWTEVIREMRRGRRELIQSIEKLPGSRRTGKSVASQTISARGPVAFKIEWKAPGVNFWDFKVRKKFETKQEAKAFAKSKGWKIDHVKFRIVPVRANRRASVRAGVASIRASAEDDYARILDKLPGRTVDGVTRVSDEKLLRDLIGAAQRYVKEAEANGEPGTARIIQSVVKKAKKQLKQLAQPSRREMKRRARGRASVRAAEFTPDEFTFRFPSPALAEEFIDTLDRMRLGEDVGEVNGTQVTVDVWEDTKNKVLKAAQQHGGRVISAKRASVAAASRRRGRKPKSRGKVEEPPIRDSNGEWKKGDKAVLDFSSPNRWAEVTVIGFQRTSTPPFVDLVILNLNGKRVFDQPTRLMKPREAKELRAKLKAQGHPRASVAAACSGKHSEKKKQRGKRASHSITFGTPRQAASFAARVTREMPGARLSVRDTTVRVSAEPRALRQVVALAARAFNRKQREAMMASNSSRSIRASQGRAKGKLPSQTLEFPSDKAAAQFAARCLQELRGCSVNASGRKVTVRAGRKHGVRLLQMASEGMQSRRGGRGVVRAAGEEPGLFIFDFDDERAAKRAMQEMEQTIPNAQVGPREFGKVLPVVTTTKQEVRKAFKITKKHGGNIAGQRLSKRASSRGKHGGGRGAVRAASDSKLIGMRVKITKGEHAGELGTIVGVQDARGDVIVVDLERGGTVQVRTDDTFMASKRASSRGKRGGRRTMKASNEGDVEASSKRASVKASRRIVKYVFEDEDDGISFADAVEEEGPAIGVDIDRISPDGKTIHVDVGKQKREVDDLARQLGGRSASHNASNAPISQRASVKAANGRAGYDFFDDNARRMAENFAKQARMMEGGPKANVTRVDDEHYQVSVQGGDDRKLDKLARRNGGEPNPEAASQRASNALLSNATRRANGTARRNDVPLIERHA